MVTNYTKYLFGGVHMNAVGIDVSKGKSMVVVMRPFGEIVVPPFEVTHSACELSKLADLLKSLPGETKVVMECTGSYHVPIANALHYSGVFVSPVHSLLIHDFGNNTIRKVKTDKADAVKIANYAIQNWLELEAYVPEEDIRKMLKAYSRQYNKYGKIKTSLKNNLISIIDQSFPDVNKLFTSCPRVEDGHQKWIDFTQKFWHAECVSSLSKSVFFDRYKRWCARNGYYYRQSSADKIYTFSKECCYTVPKNASTELLVTQAVIQLNAVSESQAILFKEMHHIAQSLPEYSVVHNFFGVGDVLASQIIAEIGDIRRFSKKSSLVCFAGLESPPDQSGAFDRKSREVSKKGSPHLRKALFQVMDCLIKQAPVNDVIYQFLDKKRSEGKHYYCYMTAGSAKFLRIYYARVKEYLDTYYPV